MTAQKILRGVGYTLAGLVGLIVLAGASVYGVSGYRMSHKFTVPEHKITPRTDSASLAQGGRLVRIRGCVDCHGANLAGNVMFDDPVLGRLSGPNLTKGGRGAELDAQDFERAIRHGVRRDGSPLRVMPALEFTTLADDDLESMIGYIQSVPSVSKPAVPSVVGPLIRVLFVAHQVDLLSAEEIDHSKSHIAHIDADSTAKYGEYIASGCKGCHGPGLSGGKIPGAPPDWKPAANITPTGIGRYSETDLANVLRTGKRPDGSQLDSIMPYRLTKEMSDLEIKAVYAFLKTVPRKEFGNR